MSFLLQAMETSNGASLKSKGLSTMTLVKVRHLGLVLGFFFLGASSQWNDPSVL